MQGPGWASSKVHIKSSLCSRSQLDQPKDILYFSSTKASISHTLGKNNGRGREKGGVGEREK